MIGGEKEIHGGYPQHNTVFDRLKAGLKWKPGPPTFIKPDNFVLQWLGLVETAQMFRNQ